MSAQSPVRVVVFVVMFVVATFAFMVLHALRGDTAAPFATTSKEAGVGLVAAVETTTEDIDGDGAQDWEEVLWSTDPKNPDSDGDGIQDGEEINAGNNPKVVGTGHVASISDTGQASTSLPHTATQAVARNLMSNFMLSIKAGETAETIDRDKIIEDALAKSKIFLEIPQFTADEVVVVPSTEDTQKAYVLAVGATFSSMNSRAQPEIQLLQQLAQGGGESTLEALRNTAVTYAEEIELFKKVPTPEDAVQVHIELINALSAYTNTLVGITYFKEDSVRAAASLNLYTARDRQLIVALFGFKQYLDRHNMFPPVPTVPQVSAANY